MAREWANLGAACAIALCVVGMAMTTALGQEQASSTEPLPGCTLSPDEALAAFTADFEAELASNQPVSRQEIEFSGPGQTTTLGTRDEYQRSHRMGARGLEILEPYRACLGPYLAANEAALIGMRDQGRQGCEMTSTDETSCALDAPVPGAVLRRNTGAAGAMQASIDRAVAWEEGRPAREAAAERERIRQQQEYARIQQEAAQRPRQSEQEELLQLQQMMGVINSVSQAAAAGRSSGAVAAAQLPAATPSQGGYASAEPSQSSGGASVEGQRPASANAETRRGRCTGGPRGTCN